MFVDETNDSARNAAKAFECPCHHPLVDRRCRLATARHLGQLGIAPTLLSSGVERGSVIAAVVIAVVTLLLVRSPVPTRWTGAALIGLYLVMYPAILA